jgi:hypothetical protein
VTKRIIKDKKEKKSKGVPPGDQERSDPKKVAPPQFSNMYATSQPLVIEGRLPLWKVAVRLIGLTLVVVLNVAFVMSSVSYHHGVKAPAHQFNEPLLYGVLMLFNIMILIPALFEVRWLKLTLEGLQLATLLWKTRLSWQDIVDFRHPMYLKVAWLRTRKCIYILNRRDLSNYGLIEAALSEKIK